MTHSTSTAAVPASGAAVAIGPFKLRARSLAFGLLLLLGLQFILGIVTNLYATIPATHPGSGASNFFVGLVQGLGWSLSDGAWALQLHVLVGLGVILLGITLVYVAYATHERIWMICASIGGVAMLSAGFSGAVFVNDGQGLSSLLMSVWFLVALISFVVGLYLTPRFTK